MNSLLECVSIIFHSKISDPVANEVLKKVLSRSAERAHTYSDDYGSVPTHHAKSGTVSLRRQVFFRPNVVLKPTWELRGAICNRKKTTGMVSWEKIWVKTIIILIGSTHRNMMYFELLLSQVCVPNAWQYFPTIFRLGWQGPMSKNFCLASHSNSYKETYELCTYPFVKWGKPYYNFCYLRRALKDINTKV